MKAESSFNERIQNLAEEHHLGTLAGEHRDHMLIPGRRAILQIALASVGGSLLFFFLVYVGSPPFDGLLLFLAVCSLVFGIGAFAVYAVGRLAGDAHVYLYEKGLIHIHIKHTQIKVVHWEDIKEMRRSVWSIWGKPDEVGAIILNDGRFLLIPHEVASTIEHELALYRLSEAGKPLSVEEIQNHHPQENTFQ